LGESSGHQTSAYRAQHQFGDAVQVHLFHDAASAPSLSIDGKASSFVTSATRTAVTAPYPARRHTHLLHFNVTLPKPISCVSSDENTVSVVYEDRRTGVYNETNLRRGCSKWRSSGCDGQRVATHQGWHWGPANSLPPVFLKFTDTDVRRLASALAFPTSAVHCHARR